MNMQRPNKKKALEQDNKIYKSRIELLERENETLRQFIADNEEPEPPQEIECDICELEQQCKDASKDLSDAQDFLQNEICGYDWPAKFKREGAGDIFNLLHCIADCNIAISNFELAASTYQLELCKSAGKAELRASLIEQLKSMVESCPDINSRCMKFIDQVLATC